MAAGGGGSSEGGSGGGVCCSDGRVWIFLVLGVLTIVFSAVLMGVYMNIQSLTSSLEELEVLPSYVPAVAGGVAGFSVLLLFWKRRKPLVYLVLFLCFCAVVLCVIIAVLTGTRVLQPLLNTGKCDYTRRARTCQCVVDGDTPSPGSRTNTKDSALLTISDVAGCSVVKDILPNMLFTMVGIYGVIALVCCINGVIAILVCRMEHNRNKMQKLEYTDDYCDTPSSSNSETFLEQQTMLPATATSSSPSNLHQQQNHRPQLSPTPQAPAPSVVNKHFTPANAILADIYTNTNAIEDASNYNEEEEDDDDDEEEEEEEEEEEGGETTSSDAVYSPSDIPVDYAEACRMRRSKSFSHPMHRSISRDRSPDSTASTSTPPPFSPNMATANSIANFLTGNPDNNTNGTGTGGGKLAPHRRRNRRAVTLHGLDRDQLMLILNLQMRYLQESDHDSKKPENFALNLTNNSTTDILMKAEEKAQNAQIAQNAQHAQNAQTVQNTQIMSPKTKAVAHDKMMDPSRPSYSKSYHDILHLKEDTQGDLLDGDMNQVISSNLVGIKGKSRSMKCVGSLGSNPVPTHGYHPLTDLTDLTTLTTNTTTTNNNSCIPNAQFPINLSSNTTQHGHQYPTTTNTPTPFSQLQKRSMTPTPRQERLSSTRTSDDEWDFKPARMVRSHTPQPHHFKNNHSYHNNYNYPNIQQDFYGDIYQQQQQQQHPYFHHHQQQQQQYPLQQQQLQQQHLHQLQQRQIQELQFQNVQQQMQENLFLEQQTAMITQQQNIIQQQQRYEELQRQQKLVLLQQQQQQQQQQQPPPQNVNERYQQIVQEQMMKDSGISSSLYSNPLTSSTLSSTAQINNNNNHNTDDNDDDDEDDDEPTLITIDLRDVTKTGPLIYENAPPPRKLSHQSGMTNSMSSLASSCFNGSSASSQPKSILHNRMAPAHHNPPNIYQISHNPQGQQMARQLSQSSNLSSCSGSIAMEIQKALEGPSTNSPLPPPAGSENPEDRKETEMVNNTEIISPGKIIKPKKKLSKKEKKELKEKEKEIKELEKEKLKEKSQVENAAATQDPVKSCTGLARSDSDVRKSGVIPDRWQTIMANSGTEAAPQTLWENVQKKITPETDAANQQQQQHPMPSSRQLQGSESSQPVPNTRGITNGKSSTPSTPNPAKRDNSDRRDPRGKATFPKNSTPNIIFPLTYDTTKTPQPYTPQQQLQQQSNSINPQTEGRPPPIGVASPTMPRLSPRSNPPTQQQPHPLPNHQSNNNKSFVPVTPNGSRLKTNPHENNNTMSVDPAAPPKPPRLHDRKQQQQQQQDGAALKPPGSQPALRPKSYVNAVGGNITDTRPNNNINNHNNNGIAPGLPLSPQLTRGHGVGANHPTPHQPTQRQGSSNLAPTPPRNTIPNHHRPNAAISPGQDVARNPVDRHPAEMFPQPTVRPKHNQLGHHPPPPHPSSHPGQGFYPPGQQLTTATTPAPPTNPIIPRLAVCDTDLDDLPSPSQATPLRCQSLSPPPYAPPPLYKSMECVTQRERSASSSSSEPHNTSCTLSEHHNASFASSERSYTPPIQREQQQQQQQLHIQRRRKGQHSLKLPSDRDHPSNRWRHQHQNQHQQMTLLGGHAQLPLPGRHHAMGRQLSLQDETHNNRPTGGYPPSSSSSSSTSPQQLSPSHYNSSLYPPPPPSSNTQRAFQNVHNKNSNTSNSHNKNQNLLNNSSSSCSSSSTSSSMNANPHQPQHYQYQQQQQQQQQQEPYMLMRRCQSMEDGANQTGGLHRTGCLPNGTGPVTEPSSRFYPPTSQIHPSTNLQQNSINNNNNINSKNNFMNIGINKNNKNNNKIFNPTGRQPLNPLPTTSTTHATNTSSPRKDLPNPQTSPAQPRPQQQQQLHPPSQTTPVSILKPTNSPAIDTTSTTINTTLYPPPTKPKPSHNDQRQPQHHKTQSRIPSTPPTASTTITNTTTNFRPPNNEHDNNMYEGRSPGFSTIPLNGYYNDSGNLPLPSVPMHEGENPNYAETTI